MNVKQYIQDFETLENVNDFSGSTLAHTLLTIYGHNRHLLSGQVQRYLEVLRKYRALYGNQEVVIARAPGRVDLMGSHTDYHQGYDLPMALDKDTVMAAGKRQDQKIVLANTDDHFAFEEFILETEILRSKPGSWENYVKASAQAFIRSYGLDRINGMNAVVAGCSPYSVPIAVGLSSSSALVISAAVALAHLHDLTMEPKRFARFCGEAEWYVGTRGGFMDHFTSILSQKGHLLFLDCRPVQVSDTETFITTDIPLPQGYDVVICNTNVKKEKSASLEYNTRVLECKLGIELLKSHFPEAQYLRDIPADAPLHTLLPVSVTLNELTDILERDTLKRVLQDHQISVSQKLKILPRCQHVVSENRRVLRGCELLRSGNIEAFGELMTESYRSIRNNFEASCAELDQMIAIVLRAPGALGARIAGAGWGGCAVTLVKTSELAAFQTQVTAAYYQRTGIHPQLFICQPSQGAGAL
jgi:galactokinase